MTDKANYLSREIAIKEGFHSRRNRDRSEQDKARATFFALHGPQGRRENAKIRDEARAARTDEAQLELIAHRQNSGKDKGQSKREVLRLQARIEEKVRKAAEPKPETKLNKVRKDNGRKPTGRN